MPVKMVCASSDLGLDFYKGFSFPKNNNREEIPMRNLSRRETFSLGASGAALALVGWRADAEAGPQEAAELIAKFTGGKQAHKDKVKIELPEIAENGSIVPLSVSVDGPMMADDYVSEVLVVAEHNPAPEVVKFKFTPMSGKAAASTRIRLAKSQKVLVVAKTSKGEFFTNQRFVKVTVGGCGG
jgi:sulfur-oxidizing protein SoxY